MSRSKQIGTDAEGGVVDFLKKNGWPHAERRTLAGIHDRGDITGTPSICWEVKGGKAAESASDGQVTAWLGETERERARDNAAIGVLVMKRKGIGRPRAGEWWAVLDGGVFADLIYERSEGEGPQYEQIGIPVRTHLANVVELLRDAGYGTPRD